MAYYVNDIIFQEDNMFNREEASVNTEEQAEKVVEESSAPVETVKDVPVTIEESVIVEQPVVIEQPIVEKPAKFVPPSITTNSNKYPGIATLTVGMENDSVKRIQKKLSEKGFAVTATGKYDRATENAVAKFCKSKGLNVTGSTVGPRTWNFLFG
jgi:hypothetical protein